MLIAVTSFAAPAGTFSCFRTSATTTALSRIPLAEARALQHRRRCLRQMGRARSRPARDPQRARRRQDRRTSRSAGCARPRTGSPTRSRAHGVARGDRVAMLLPQTPGSSGRAHRDLQARRGRGAAGDPVRRRCAELPAAERGREGRHHQRAGARQARRDPRRAAGARAGALDRRPGRRRARPLRDDRARVRRSSRRPTRRRTIPR